MSKYSLLIASCRCFLVVGPCSLFCCSQLRADYIGSSATFSVAHNEDTFSGSGPFFSISGTTIDHNFYSVTPGFKLVSPGEPGPFFGCGFPAVGCMGTVDFTSGHPFPANATGDITAYSEASFAVPENPTTYSLPGFARGSFSAVPVGCPSVPGCPPIGSYPVNLIFVLPGNIELTFSLEPMFSPPNCHGTGPDACEYGVKSTFVSSPVPEPSNTLLLLYGTAVLTAASMVRRRRST
jgi:hypothetical protein